MGNKAPPPPNFTGAAQQEAGASAANVGSQTAANRANQGNPYASSSWSFDPSTGQWSQQSGFTGAAGQAFGELGQQAASAYGSPMDNGSATRDKVVSQLYGGATQRLDPQWRLNDEQSQSALANAGADPTSAAGRAGALQEQQGKNDAYGQAMMNAQQQGTAAQEATFNENMQARNNPLQQLESMYGLLGQSGYSQAGLAQAPNLLGAAMAGGNYGLEANQQNNQILGGLGQAGGSVLSGLGQFAPLLFGL